LNRDAPKCEDVRRPSILALVQSALSASTFLLLPVLWTRLLAPVIGAPEASRLTLFALLFGVGAGHLLPARVVNGSRRVAGWAQLALGVHTAAMPWLASTAGAVSAGFGLALTATALLPATIAMGIALRRCTQLFMAQHPMPPAAGGLPYATALIGGILGLVGGVQLMLPAVGVVQSLLAAACLNVGVAGWFLVTRRGAADAGSLLAESPHVASWSKPAVAVLLVVCLTGAMAALCIVAWTRILAAILGPGLPSLTLTVSICLSGLVLGHLAGMSALARWSGRISMTSIAWLLILSGGSAYASLWTARAMPRLFLGILDMGPDSAIHLLAARVAVATALTLPTSFCLGTVVPVAAEMHRRGARTGTGAHVVVATALFGATGGLLVVLAAHSGHATLDELVRLGMLGSMTSALAIAVTRRRLHLATLGFAALCSVVGMAVDLTSGRPVYANARSDDAPLTSVGSPGAAGAPVVSRLRFYRDGRTATIGVQQIDRRILMQMDGRIAASNSAADVEATTLAAHLPMFAVRDPMRAAVIGWGSGVSISAVLAHPVETVDAFESDPAVVEASAFFFGLTDRPGDDERLRLVEGDARRGLRRTAAIYDVIVSLPSTPWVARAAERLNLDFFELAASRLAPDGVISQRIPPGALSEQSLRSLVATFLQVFPHAVAFGHRDVILLGSRQPIRLNLSDMTHRFRRSEVAASLARAFVSYPADLLVKLSLDEMGTTRLAEGGVVTTDDNLRLELAASRTAHLDDAAVMDTTLRQHEPSPVSVIGHDNDPDVWLELAASSFTAGRLDHALSYCQQAIALQASFAGFKLLGQIEQRLGRPDLARAAWDAALAAGGDRDGRRFVYALIESLDRGKTETGRL
jgi:spermidine synthase